MKQHSRLLLGATLALVACGTEKYPSNPTPIQPQNEAPVATQQELGDGMRKLWTEHVFWTRVFIISVVSNGADRQAATDRLLQNQVDLGDAIKPYYGDDAGNQLTALLKEHILQAADLLAAAKANDAAKLDAAKTAWFGNADRIAKFLSDANPAWPYADTQKMMHDHLNLTLAEATAQLMGNWDADVAAYDQVQDEILMMADTLASGIQAQFPKKVSRIEMASGLHTGMRKLWQDHILWTRMFIIDDVANLPGTQTATARLLRNQVDIGQAVKAYYGASAGDQLAALLKEHILGAARLLDAFEAGDTTAQAAAKTAWEANADQISDFLAGANPNLKADELRDMMRMHLQTTIDEAGARLKSDYAADVAAYDAVEEHILGLADALAAAVEQQFPNGPPANPAP